jgi:uncharacterized phiE125 gp8 family phage protein
MSDVSREYITVVTEPAEEPVSLMDALDHIRADTNDEDPFIESLITAARRHVERVVGKTLVSTTFDYTIQRFPGCIVLPRYPASSVTSITYNDNAGASQTLAASNYTVSLGSEDMRGTIEPAVDQSWPTTYAHVDDVTVRFIAGFGTAADVPQTYKHMILLLLGHWDMHRESTIEGTISRVPLAFDALANNERAYGFV